MDSKIWQSRPHVALQVGSCLWRVRDWNGEFEKHPVFFLMPNNRHDLLYFLLFRLSQAPSAEHKRNIETILMCDEFKIQNAPVQLILVTSMIDLNKDIAKLDPSFTFPTSLLQQTDSFAAAEWFNKKGLPGWLQTPDYLNIHQITDIAITSHPNSNLVYHRTIPVGKALELCKD